MSEIIEDIIEHNKIKYKHLGIMYSIKRPYLTKEFEGPCLQLLGGGKTKEEAELLLQKLQPKYPDAFIEEEQLYTSSPYFIKQ